MIETILDAVRRTPLIPLQRITQKNGARIFVKYEGLQVGGSIKTRTAYAMIMAALKEGMIHKNTVILEPTSGNQGIGLALVGAVLGIPVKILMPDSVSIERKKLMEQYGAEVILVKDKGNIGECMETCRKMAEKMAREDENIYVPDQFSNLTNPKIHEETTAMEIIAQMEGNTIDGFCAGIGTGGTITGIGHVLKGKYPYMKIWAIEPMKAAILSDGPVSNHLQMGIGDGLIPEILDLNVYDEIMVVEDEEAIAMAKRLAREEGILCGISGGTNVAAALQMAKELGPGKNVVTILPDTGERYFSTLLFER